MQKIKGLKPAGCDRMTLAEIDFALADTEGRVSGGGRNMTDEEIEEELQEWEQLTPAQKLARGR